MCHAYMHSCLKREKIIVHSFLHMLTWFFLQSIYKNHPYIIMYLIESSM